jgi:MATE family multidrug resistance protein
MMSSSSSTEEEQKLSNGNVKQAEYLKKFDLAEEAMLLLKISVPSVAVQFGLYFIFPQTASVIGRRLGSEELAGFSLASLTGNLTCLSVMVGALSANDTLMPRAYGTGRLSEVGILAIRGFLVCLALLIVPMVPLCTVVDAIFDALGQDPIAAELASRWIRIYLLGVPFVLLFRTTQRFLAAQHLVMPLVFGGLISCIFIHPFLLSIFIPRMGFLGSGFAIVATQTSQILLVFVYLHLRPVYHPDTWKGLSLSTLKEAVRPEPMMGFLRLSLGGVFALSVRHFNCRIQSSLFID